MRRIRWISPRGVRTPLGVVGTLEEVLYGPSHHVDGTRNIVGALKRAMANCGYLDLKKLPEGRDDARARISGIISVSLVFRCVAQEPSEHSLC